MDAYPGLGKNPAYWRMFLLLLKTGFSDDKYLGHDLIDSITDNDRYNAIDFLNDFRRDVLPKFMWQESEKTESSKGKARVVINTGLSQLDYEIWHEDRCFLRKNKKDRVYIETGQKWSRKKQSIINKEHQLIMQHEANKAIEESQKIILEYHASLSQNIYTKTVYANRLHAYDYILNCGKTREEKESLYMLVDDICNYPKPIYHIASEKTARLYPFPGNKNLTNIKREIRRALTKGCIEADLSNAHLAIIAKDWNIVSLQKLLLALRQQNVKIWQYFAQQMGLILTPRLKDTLKVAIYSLCYGSSKINIINRINIELEMTGTGEKFLALPIMQDILMARQQTMENLKFFYDTEDISIIKEHTPAEIRSLLSCRSQAIEQILIAEVYKAIAGHPRTFILIYSYDGVTFYAEDHKKEQIMKILKSAVDKKAKEIDVITTLDFELI